MEVAMTEKIFLMILVGLAFLSVPKRLLAQASDKVVILSPRVGAVIDASERDHFRLFPQIKGFARAVVCESPQKTYYARIAFAEPDGEAKDTTVQLEKDYLLTLAEQIDHFEDLEKGVYQMGQQPATLKVVEPQTRVGTKPPELQSDILPFASKAEGLELESFPQVGFGVGLSSYSPDLSGVRDAFTAIEDKYRKQGYSITHHNESLDVGTHFSYNLRIRLSQHFGLIVAAGKSTEGTVTTKIVSASGLYSFRFRDVSWLRPYIGLGICHSQFSTEVHYNSRDRISPVSSYGSYAYLDALSADGGNTGFALLGGVELAPQGSVAIEGYLSYLGIGKLQTTVDNTDQAAVNLSSLIAGARIMIYF
jgi:opacity protein-like surface antigen